MNYKVEFPDRVSDSVFIYYIGGKILHGCDAVIKTNRDEEIYDERSLAPIRFEDLQFSVQTNFFKSKPADGLEDKIKSVEQKQVERNWNCIRLDREDEFESAIQNHLAAYKLSLRNRLILTGRHASLNEGDEYA